MTSRPLVPLSKFDVAPLDRPDRVVLLAAAAVALALPFLLEGFVLYLFTNAAVLALAILGLNLLTGFSGQISLGQGAFVALGAYAEAAAVNHFGLDAYSAVVASGAVGFVVGFLFGWPALRLGFVALAMVTYGLAIVLPHVLKSTYLERWTGGVQGIYPDRPEPPGWFPGSEDQWWYLVVLAFLLAAAVAARNLVRSRSGRALMALRDDPLAARASGINISLYKTLAFGLAAAAAAMAGALGALLSEFVAPDQFTIWLSFMLLIGAVVGGLTSIAGAVIGGLFLQYLPDAAGLASKGLAFPALGPLLILLILLWPDGVVGRYRHVKERIGQWRAKAATRK